MQVGKRFQDQQVHAGFHQRGGLFKKDLPRPVAIHPADRREAYSQRSHAARYVSIRPSGLPGDPHTGLVDGGHLLSQAIRGKARAVGAERVGGQDIGPGVAVVGVDPPDELGFGEA